MSIKKSVLILYNKVWPYRIEIFDLLNEKYDLTVAYTEKEYLGKSFRFKTLYTPGYKIGPFFVHRCNVYKLAKEYNVVIGLHDIRWLSVMALSMLKRKFKLLYWGIGVTASYRNKFDKKHTWDKVRYFFSKRADALIFYSDYPLNNYMKNGFNPEMLFVADNTVAVPTIDNLSADGKSDFLFIGTLYKEKSVDFLIDVYAELLKIRNEVPKLHIIGGGPQEAEIRQMVTGRQLSDKIELHGAIYDKDVIKNFFLRSIVCISPNQAGLSVLTSMGFGVPYLTNSDAYTGGEIFNINNKENGLIYNGGKEDLIESLIWVIDNKDKMLEMGKKAQQFYNQSRKPEHMAGSIIDAIEYSLKKK